MFDTNPLNNPRARAEKFAPTDEAVSVDDVSVDDVSDESVSLEESVSVVSDSYGLYMGRLLIPLLLLPKS